MLKKINLKHFMNLRKLSVTHVSIQTMDLNTNVYSFCTQRQDLIWLLMYIQKLTTS